MLWEENKQTGMLKQESNRNKSTKVKNTIFVKEKQRRDKLMGKEGCCCWVGGDTIQSIGWRKFIGMSLKIKHEFTNMNSMYITYPCMQLLPT